MICPKDFKPCMDDICVYSCIRMPECEPLAQCHVCRQIVGPDVDCACEPEPYDYDTEDEQPGIG